MNSTTTKQRRAFPSAHQVAARTSLLRRVFLLPAIAVVCVLEGAGTGRCSVVLQDDFEGADEVQASQVVDSKAVWESDAKHKSAGVIRDPGGFGGSKVLVVANNVIFARFPEVKLGDGDSLELSLKFRCADAKIESTAPLRFGLANNTDGMPDTGDTQGYWVMSTPGPNGTTSVMLEKNVDSLIGGGPDFDGLGPAVPTPYDWQSVHSLKLKVSKPAGGTVSISFKIDDGGEQVFTDPKGTVTSFNTIGFRIANTAKSQLLVDDVILSTGEKQ